MLLSPPPSGPMTADSLAQWSRARALNDPDLSPARPTSGSKATPVAAPTTHAQSIRAALRRADDIYFAACQRDWEMYAVGASLARFLDSTRDQTDWFQLGARSQFEKCLAKGKAMSRDQLIRGLALPYDPCDALVGFACQSGRTFTADPSMRNHDFFGFRVPPYTLLNDNQTSSAGVSAEHPEHPFSRVEAAQIFSVHTGAGAHQTLQADFPGHILISLSRMNVSPDAAAGSGGIDLDAGHVFEPNQIALDLVWIDPEHFIGVMDEPKLPDGETQAPNAWSEHLTRLKSLPTRQPASHYYSHAQVKRLVQLTLTPRADNGSAEPTLSHRTDSGLLSDQADLDGPALDPKAHGELRKRCAQYLTVLTAPRARLRVSLASLAKVSLVNDGASTRLGRGVLVLEISHPVELDNAAHGGSEWPDAHEWSASPRLFIFGYFSELYAVLRRLVFLVPAMEGVVYRGDVEEFRNVEYHVQFPHELTMYELGVGEWTIEFLEGMDLGDLWALAEACGIRKLVPRDADAFTIAEHLVVYARVHRGDRQHNEEAGVNKDEYAGEREEGRKKGYEKEHDAGVIRRRLRSSCERKGGLHVDAVHHGQLKHEGLIPAATSAGIMEAAAAAQAQTHGADVANKQQRKPWTPAKTMMFIVAIALLFRQFVSFLIASTVRKSP